MQHYCTIAIQTDNGKFRSIICYLNNTADYMLGALSHIDTVEKATKLISEGDLGHISENGECDYHQENNGDRVVTKPQEHENNAALMLYAKFSGYTYIYLKNYGWIGA